MTICKSPEQIPQSLKLEKRWIVWKYETRDGVRTKIPYCPWTTEDDRPIRADSTDPATWGTYGDATTVARRYHFDGVGFMLGDGYTGIDLDKCRDTTGMIAEWASKIIGAVWSYSEVSPSGTGIKIVCRATKPGPKCRTNSLPGFEMYDKNRFFTLTGEHFGETPRTVEDRQEQIDKLYSTVFPVEPTATKPAATKPAGMPLEDARIVSLASEAANGAKFKLLYQGDTSDYHGDHSAADQAFVNILDFWTHSNVDQIDRLFRSSGLMRGKWERQDYRDSTIGFGTARQIDRYRAPEIVDVTGAEKIIKDASQCDLSQLPSGAPETTTRKRRAFTPAQYLDIPKARYLVRKHVVERSLCLIYGGSGAGKSFFGLTISFAVATGKPLFDQWQVQRGDVLYLVSEGDGSFGVRLEAYCKHHGLDLAGIENMALIPEAFNFQDTNGTLGELSTILTADCPTLKPKIVVVDTLNKNIMGDENSPLDMQRFIRTCEAIKKNLGCTVIIIHHTGKDDTRGARGHSSLFAACDTVLKVEGDSESNMATVYCEKQKSAKPFGKYNLEKTVVEVDPLDLDNPDSVVLTFMGEEMTTEEKMAVFVGLFPVDKGKTVKMVLADDRTTLDKINWTSLKTLKNRATDAVSTGLLVVAGTEKGNGGDANLYRRIVPEGVPGKVSPL